MHILGAAGTGKLYLIKQLQIEMTKHDRKCISSARTNLVVLIITRITLHKFVSKLKLSSIYEEKNCYIIGKVSTTIDFHIFC